MGGTVLDMFNFMFGGGMFKNMADILSANPSVSSSKYYNAWELVMDVYKDFIVPIGLGLMVIWFLVAFVQKASSEQMNFDQIFLLLVKLIVAFYLIEHGIEIFAKLWGLGNSLVHSFTAQSDGGLSEESINSAWKSLTGLSYPSKPGFFKSIGCIVQLVFPWIVCWVLSGVATFIAYSRMIEMLLRVMVAPIALSDFINDGLHSTAWRYIKTFLAICLQGFIILLIANIYSAIMSKAIWGSGFMDIALSYLVISFAAVSLMFKSLSLCKEIVGAQ